jgi:hypothetical protein
MIKHAFAITALATASLATLAIPAPAMAQGSREPITRHEGKGGCPWGWNAGRGGSQSELKCYIGSSGSPAYYNPERKPCAENYRTGPGSTSYYCWERSGEQADERSAADKLVSYGTVTKANRLDRCPLGYFSKADMTVCTTRLSPAPQSRNKQGACNSNEIDEWGLYCTANASSITRAQAEQEADRDFNAIYSANGAKGPTQTPSGDDVYDSAPMVAAYGRKGGAAVNAASDNGSAATESKTAQCDTSSNGSATGAAVGGAVAGDAGAVLGSVLGGLGKKKKKKAAGC